MVLGGAMFDSYARLRQLERECGRRSGRTYVSVPVKRFDGPVEESFRCFFLCNECGLLEEEVARDAYREAQDGGPMMGRSCPNCADSAWVDLNHIDTALALRECEARQRLSPTGWAKRRALGVTGAVGLLVWVVAMIGLVASGAALAAPVAGAAAVAAGLTMFAFYQLFKRRLFVHLHGARELRPARWKMPLPLPEQTSRTRRTLRGPAIADGELLRAPITGRACIGYELGVLFEAEGDARPPMWVLEEERSTDFSVAGERILADTATLEIALEVVAEDDVHMAAKDIAVFLRKRGLFATDGRFSFFEAVLEPDRPCEVRYHEEPADAGPVVRLG